MIRKEVLKALIKKYQNDLSHFENSPRELNPKLQNKFAIIISGIRRCGKSTLAKQLVKNKKTYYFHFENVQLATFEQKDFTKLDETFKEELGEKGIYLLDEIQNIKGWEIYVRGLVDDNNKVIITGSNASMLSKELGTRLTGRNLKYELYPFSYAEFLKLTNKKESIKSFDNYFLKGGFPEYITNTNEDILRNLFQDIFYRDILVRNEFRREPELKQFVAFISSNIGVEISFNKLKKILGLGSANTVAQFMMASEQAYLFFSINKFDYSIKKQQINPKKIYCVDNALLQLNSFTFSENKGRYLENIVFVQLKRKKEEIYYHKKNHECDFVIKKGMKITKALQVCYNLNDENEKREIEGIIEACKTYGLKKGTILTYNQEDKLEQENIQIEIIPTWKWLLQN
jgi:predicted AAA+ superfamily ATPase